MNEAWRDAVHHATLAVRGDSIAAERALRSVERLCGDASVLHHPALSHDLALLTALLDSLGRQAASRALLQHVVARLAWDPEGLNLDTASRNRLAVTLADRGYLAAAATVLSSALHFASDVGARSAHTLANLAALRMRLRDIEGAARAAARARRRLAATGQAEEEPGVRLLVLAVLTEVTRRQGRDEDADRLLDELEQAVRSLVALRGGEHPQSLSALVTLATAEFESARAAGDRDRMRRAAHVLAVASQKSAATMGAHHPQAVAALLSLAAVEGETVREARGGHGTDDVRALLAEAERRWGVMRRGEDPAPATAASVPGPPAPRDTYRPRPVPTSPPFIDRSVALSTATDRGGEGMPTLRFSVLGPVRAWRGAEPLPTGSPQQRALLAALLLREGRPATATELIGELWGEEPPSQALAAVRTYASRLRKVLGPGVLTSESGGYALATGAGSVDLADARRLVTAAEELRSGGERGRARDMLDRALALWDGEPLAGVPGPHAAAQRTGLEEWRLHLCETRLGLDLELGHDAEAVSELTALIAVHPLRERLRELLMLALYLGGRQAEALAVYEDTRRLIADELGVEPSSGLRELHRRILATNRVPGDTAPTRDEAGPRAVRPSQLPAPVADFTGRSAFVRELSGLLADPRGAVLAISAVVGGGVGKTTLAVHVAHQVRQSFPDGQLYVNLQGSGARPAEPEAVLGSFLRALGLTGSAIPDSVEERSALYRSVLHGRRVLVLLDNARDAAQVRPLIPSSEGCATLVTSRARLVGLAGAHLVDLDVMNPDEALQLFTGIVGAERVRPERGAALDVVAACGFLPLAIRIAAARLAARRTWTVSVLAAKLSDERGRLDELWAGDLAVKATFEMGYRQLDPEQARAFRLVGLADGPDISLAAAAALLDQPPDITERITETLVDTGFLEAAAPGRYRYHDLTRLYARTCAERDASAPGERTAALTRLLDFYLATATGVYAVEHPGDRSVEHLEPIRYPGVEFSYLEDARRWLASEAQCILSCVRQLAHGSELRRSIDLLWSVKDIVGSGNSHQYQDAAAVAQRAAREAGDARAEGRACAALTAVHLTAGNLREAEAEAHRALALAVAIDDPVTSAWVPYDRGVIALQERRYPAADRCLQEALSRFRADDNPYGVASALCQLSHLEASLGNAGRAVELAEEAIERLGSEAATLALAESRYALGLALSAAGQAPEALRQLEEAIGIYQDCTQALGEGMAHYRCAEIHLGAGRPAQAAAEAEEALAMLGRVGGAQHRADVLVVLGDAMAARGETARARTCWTEARAVYEEVLGPEGFALRDHLNARLAGRPVDRRAARPTGT